MRNSDSFAQIATALAAAQGAFPPIPKDRSVTVKMRSGGQYTFSYAPLDTIIEKTRKPLAENGLTILQGVVTDDKGADYLRTMLVHSSGEWFSNDTPMFTAGGENASQGYASGMTYARRYGYSAILCLAADDDDDGNGNDDGQRGPRQKRDQAESRQPRSDRPSPQRPKSTGAGAQSSELPWYAETDFAANLPKWWGLIASGTKTADELIAMLQSKAKFTPAQLQEIRNPPRDEEDGDQHDEQGELA